MKTLKLNLIVMALFALFLTSCASEDDGIYFEKVEEIENIKVEYTVIELEILDLVNSYRATKGIDPLTKLNIVSTVAESHAQYMAETGKVSHDNFQERHQQLVSKANARKVGENVGFGFNSAKGIVNAWIKSDSHRNIIENENFTHFGISTAKNNEGRNYFTQIFIER